MNFAKIAKSLREETGLSQQKLADNLGTKKFNTNCLFKIL